jgi:hypothetical protein
MLQNANNAQAKLKSVLMLIKWAVVAHLKPFFLGII